MASDYSVARKFRFAVTVVGLYALTLGFIGYALHPAGLLRARTVALTETTQPHLPRRPHLVAGRPVRIVIPAQAVDLPVDPGYYDATTNAWTLSGYHAQFAMLSTLANNYSGDTFIYGHNNNYVFGALRHHTPAPGALALVYTDNGHILAYSFVSVRSLGPNDVAALDYSGPSVLTIQTCTGGLNEWRTMYRFDFSRVVQ